MRVLNLSLDVFIDPISRWAGGDRARLSDDFYYAWKPQTVEAFLEQRCGISANNPVPGVVVEDHQGAYAAWRDWIAEDRLKPGFDLVSIDAHSNLGGNDVGWFYLCGRVLHWPLEKRHDLDEQRITPENFLLFAMARRWLRSVTLVTHPDWQHDVLPMLYENEDPGTQNLQLKCFDGRVLEQALEYGMDLPQPLSLEPTVPFSVLGTGQYHESRPFDLAVVSRSANFTPKGADALLPVLESVVRPR